MMGQIQYPREAYIKIVAINTGSQGKDAKKYSTRENCQVTARRYSNRESRVRCRSNDHREKGPVEEQPLLSVGAQATSWGDLKV